MSSDEQDYRAAEQAYLTKAGVNATDRMVPLARLGGEVRIVDAGEGNPVFFVPGAATTGVVFADLVGQLDGFRRIMVERPGRGLSPLAENPPKTLAAKQQFADDFLVDLLDGLEIERASVVSTSLGGYATFRGAAAYPDRFDRIVGLGFQVGARIAGAPLSMRSQMPGWMMPRRMPVNRRLLLTMLKSAGMRRAIEEEKFSDEMADWMVALLSKTPTFRNESLFSARPIGLRGPIDVVRHRPELLAKITAPVHLFWAHDDIFGNEQVATEFAALLPNATVQMVADAGHAPWLDQLELATAAVRRHLAG